MSQNKILIHQILYEKKTTVNLYDHIPKKKKNFA